MVVERSKGSSSDLSTVRMRKVWFSYSNKQETTHIFSFGNYINEVLFWQSFCVLERPGRTNLMYLLPFDMKRLSSLDISDTLLGAARYNKIANFSPNIINKGNNKITELRTILQRESQNS
jgi:hypothetical protein